MHIFSRKPFSGLRTEDLICHSQISKYFLVGVFHVLANYLLKLDKTADSFTGSRETFTNDAFMSVNLRRPTRF